jgi:hypothetical protein
MSSVDRVAERPHALVDGAIGTITAGGDPSVPIFRNFDQPHERRDERTI